MLCCSRGDEAVRGSGVHQGGYCVVSHLYRQLHGVARGYSSDGVEGNLHLFGNRIRLRLLVVVHL
jgi:hypothetical protein